MIAVGQALGAPLVGAAIDHADHVVAFLACAALGVLGALIKPPLEEGTP